MADITAAALRNRVLEHIRIKPAGEDASAEDASLVDEALTACHAKLRKAGLVPFDTSAIPDWAQNDLRDYVAAEVKDVFGLPGDKAAEQMMAERGLAKQVSGFKHPRRVMASYF